MYSIVMKNNALKFFVTEDTLNPDKEIKQGINKMWKQIIHSFIIAYLD